MLTKSSSENSFYKESPPLVTVNSHWQNFKDSFKRPEQDLELNTVPQLKQGLKKRQLQMIALSGCVGSGLLVTSGMALSHGPATVLVAWGIVATFLFATMQSLAELAAVYPVSGSFATYATRFLDPSIGFAMGWNYAMFWVVVLPLELVGLSLTINFWPLDINPAAWVSIFYVLIIVLNLCGTAGFGEAEFVAAIVKLLGIVGFDILAIVLIAGGGKQGYVGVKNWHHPNAFVSGFKGVASVLITATYSFGGTELVGLTATESKENPRIALPKAIKQVFWRILIFYMLSLTLVGFLVPSDSPDLLKSTSNASNSPFVLAIKSGGIKALPSIFNVVVLVALLSIGNSAVYGFSRTMLGMAEQGLAPKWFTYVDRKGRPLVGLGTSLFVGLLSFVSASPKQGEVFAWLVALSALSTLFTWGCINGSLIQFRRAWKKAGRSLDELPYKSMAGIWGAWYGLIMNVIVLGLQFWISLFPVHEKPDPTVFFQNYLGFVVFFVFYFAHKIYSRQWRPLVKLSDIDLDYGRQDVDVELLAQEILEEKAAASKLPIWRKVLRVFC